MGLTHIQVDLKCDHCGRYSTHLIQGVSADDNKTTVEKAGLTCKRCNRKLQIITHYFTAADIERIVAIACREQRYKCVDKFSEANPEWHGDAAISIQNAPAPKTADVLAELEKSGNPNGDTQ